MNVEVLLIVVFGLLSIGLVLVLYGSIAKNRWGINLASVVCPRCRSPLPRLREPRNARQAFWGGGTCAKCDVEVDKWGREIAPATPAHLIGSTKPEAELQGVVKRRLVVYTAAGYFCLTLLFGLLGTGPHPSTAGGWVAFAAIAVLETAVFTLLFYWASVYVLKRAGQSFRPHQD